MKWGYAALRMQASIERWIINNMLHENLNGTVEERATEP